MQLWTISTLNLVVASAALIGTSLQAYEALLQLRDHHDLDLHSTIDDWQNEIPRRHPIARRRQKLALRELSEESPTEWKAYRRLELILTSWSALIVASLAALISALI